MQIRTAPARSAAPPAATSVVVERWSTSVPAVLALVVGVLALVAPLGPVRLSVSLALALTALLLGVIGMTQGTRPGITGRGVAITGVLLGCSSLVVAVTAAMGFA